MNLPRGGAPPSQVPSEGENRNPVNPLIPRMPPGALTSVPLFNLGSVPKSRRLCNAGRKVVLPP